MTNKHKIKKGTIQDRMHNVVSNDKRIDEKSKKPVAKTKSNQIKKLTGKVYWIYGNLHLLNEATAQTLAEIGVSNVSRAIIYDNKLNFDFEANGDFHGGVAKCFIYSDDKVLGKSHYSDDSEIPDESIDGSIFYNQHGCVVFGKWWEQNHSVSFIAELKYVEEFLDEKKPALKRPLPKKNNKQHLKVKN